MWSACYSKYRFCRRSGNDYNEYDPTSYCRYKLEHLIIGPNETKS